MILEASPEAQQHLSSLDQIYLPSSLSSTGQVPLSAIATVQQQTAPLAVSHIAQFPSVSISFNLAPNASLGTAVDEIKKAEAELGMPISIITSFQGAALAFQAALSNEVMLIVAAGMTIVMIAGEFDVSVGSVVGLSAAVAGWIMVRWLPAPSADDHPWW